MRRNQNEFRKFDEQKKIGKNNHKNWSHTYKIIKQRQNKTESELFRPTLSTRLVAQRQNESIDRTVCKIQSTSIYHFYSACS